MLSAEEMQRFARDGYLGPFDLPRAVIDPCLEEAYLAKVSAVTGDAGPGRDRARNQHLYSKSLVELVTAAPILERVRVMLGDDVLLWVAHIMPRQPGAGGQKWHTDAINQYIRGIHVSIALSGMNRDNGCLSLVAGSHNYRTSLWAHEQRGLLDRSDAEAVLRIADRDAPWNAPHAIRHMELEPGQFFFTWGGLWHGVGPNATDDTRIACVARYCRPDFRCCDYGFRDDRITEGPLQPCLLVHGTDHFQLNDIRPPPTGDMFR